MIDLSQFEGMTPGPFEALPKLSGSENHRGYSLWSTSGAGRIADVYPIDHDGREGGFNARAFAAVPDLIRELAETREALAKIEAAYKLACDHINGESHGN